MFLTLQQLVFNNMKFQVTPTFPSRHHPRCPYIGGKQNTSINFLPGQMSPGHLATRTSVLTRTIVTQASVPGQLLYLGICTRPNWYPVKQYPGTGTCQCTYGLHQGLVLTGSEYIGDIQASFVPIGG